MAESIFCKLIHNNRLVILFITYFLYRETRHYKV